jgi:hypothetical protein
VNTGNDHAAHPPPLPTTWWVPVIIGRRMPALLRAPSASSSHTYVMF